MADIGDLVLKEKERGGRGKIENQKRISKALKFLEGEYIYRRELLRKREKFKVFDLPDKVQSSLSFCAAFVLGGFFGGVKIDKEF